MHLTEFRNLCKGITKDKGTSFQCLCPNPSHKDNTPSLSVTEGDDKIMLYCHAGCHIEEILPAMGLEMKDLFYNQIAPTTPTTIKYVNRDNKLSELTFGDDQFVRAIYDYTDEYGNYICSKLRFQKPGEKKTLVYAIKRGDTYFAGINGVEKGLYNLPALLAAINKHQTVYYVEGEKDVDTLAKLGLVATTCGGADDWKAEYAKYFIGAQVVILRDNDEPGDKLAKAIQKDLRKAAHASKIVLTSDAEHGDVTDYLESLKTTDKDEKKKTLIELINGQGSWVYAYWVHTEIKNNSIKQSINAGIMAETLKQTLKYLIVKNEGLGNQFLYIYDHGVYRLVEKLEFQYYIKRYIPIQLQKVKTINEVFGLLTMETCTVNAEQLDIDENIINFKNGILHLDTMKIEPHNPKYLSTIQIPIDYEPDITKCTNKHVFDNYLEFLTSGNKGTQKLLLEILGLCISNVYGYRTKKCLFMVGDGNSGKSQLKALITELIGSRYVSPISLERLNKPFGASSIYCKRVIGCNDLPFTSLSELNVLKELTGGDPIDVEFKQKNSFAWTFKGFPWFTMNKTPKFGGDKGDWVYERIIIINCNNVVPEDRRDPKLVLKMLEEGQYIVNLAVTHLKSLIDNRYKLSETEEVKAAREEYKIENDSFLEFLHQCETTDTTKTIKRSLLWKVYTDWCKVNKRGMNKQKECFAVLQERGMLFQDSKDRQMYVCGIELKNETFDNIEEIDDGFPHTFWSSKNE